MIQHRLCARCTRWVLLGAEHARDTRRQTAALYCARWHQCLCDGDHVCLLHALKRRVAA